MEHRHWLPGARTAQLCQHAELCHCHCRVLELAQKELQKAVQGVEDKERRAVAAQTAAAQVPAKFNRPVTHPHNAAADGDVAVHPATSTQLSMLCCAEEGRVMTGSARS